MPMYNYNPCPIKEGIHPFFLSSSLIKNHRADSSAGENQPEELSTDKASALLPVAVCLALAGTQLEHHSGSGVFC